MKLKHTKEPYNYGGLPEVPVARARVVVLPVPYESTTTYGGGTSKGPAAIIEASRHMELWDSELKRDVSRLGFSTLPELEPDMTGPEATVNRVGGVVSALLTAKKWPLVLGGEHSITPGVVSALRARYRNLSVLQIDAHTDLRNEYQGTRWSHACAMRRVYDLGVPAVAVGVRSTCEEEIAFIKQAKLEHRIFEAPHVPIAKVLKGLTSQVYVTVDLDGFDPSLVPGTGTPEPGGLDWYQVIELLKAVAQRHKIVGADIVELAPLPGQPAADFLAAKLGYKLIGYSFFGKR